MCCGGHGCPACALPGSDSGCGLRAAGGCGRGRQQAYTPRGGNRCRCRTGTRGAPSTLSLAPGIRLGGLPSPRAAPESAAPVQPSTTA